MIRLQRTYRQDSKDAFTIIYECRKIGDSIYGHELVTTLPEECLDFVHYRFFCRMTEDYIPTTTEAVRMLNNLSDKLLEEKKFKAFYFHNCLLINGFIGEEQLDSLLKMQKRFTVQPGMHFCSNTRSLEFTVLLKELNRFKIFKKKVFNKRFKAITRKEFEKALIPGRMGLDYIELYIPQNTFFTLFQDHMKYFFLCNEHDIPTMVIAHSQEEGV